MLHLLRFSLVAVAFRVYGGYDSWLLYLGSADFPIFSTQASWTISHRESLKGPFKRAV